MLTIKPIVVGPIAANCYLVFSRENGTGVVIDPGAESDKILKAARKTGADFQLVINTHGHFDHILADGIKDDLAAPLAIHHLDAPLLKEAAGHHRDFLGFLPSGSVPEPNRLLREGERLDIGGDEFFVWHTPGHSRGSICLVGREMVFTGDTLFQNGVGRTDLGGGSTEQLQDSLRRLFRLPDNVAVYPGHGPATTIGCEKHNLFLE